MKKTMLMFCLIQTHRFPSWKQRRENYDLIQLFQKWPLEKSRKQKCFENGLYVQMHMENTLLSTAGFLEPLVLPWTLWFSVGNGRLMHGIPQPLFSHIRMVPEGPGILLYKVLTVVSGLLPFSIIEINSCCCVYHSTSFSLLCYIHIPQFTFPF